MPDILKAMRDQEAMLHDLDEAVRAALAKLAQHRPDAKVFLQLPGTEPKLNGVSQDVLNGLQEEFPDDVVPTTREILEKLGGNPASSRDKARVSDWKKRGLIPGFVYTAGVRSSFKRLPRS